MPTGEPAAMANKVRTMPTASNADEARTIFPASKSRVASDEMPPDSISAETTAAPTRGERTPVASITSEGINER
jgi:hypothetical protein